jgi:N-acetylglucosamine kinase-like BadF-type ATPase
MPRLFVGIDLGGSGTRAALADAEGSLLASGRGPAVGHKSGSAGRRSLGRALDAALAPIGQAIVAEACVIHAGATGLSIPGRREALHLELTSRFPRAQVQVSNDALIALWGGLAGREGVAVLAGTGSIALARSADGREARAGGWGYLLGDEGGGQWLGRGALSLYLQVLEGRVGPSTLTELVGGAVAALTVSDVLGWFYGGSDQVTRLAALAPLVARAAEAGDQSADDMLCRASEALSELVVSAARQLWPAVVPEPLNVACCGGVWQAGRVLAAPFAAALAARLTSAAVRPALLPPAAGAILLAMRADERPISPELVHLLVEAYRSANRW